MGVLSRTLPKRRGFRLRLLNGKTFLSCLTHLLPLTEFTLSILIIFPFNVKVEAASLEDAGFINEMGTQTPGEEFVEVQTFFDASPNRRSVQTQTDPRLKKKKFGPLSHDMECDTMDLEDEEDYDEYRR